MLRFAVILTAFFLALRIWVVGWSLWWVFSPLLVYAALFFLIFATLGFFTAKLLKANNIDLKEFFDQLENRNK